MITAVYPGSFDPVTYGHLDIIQRSVEIFDKVIIGVLNNQTKTPLFDFEERVEMLQTVTQDFPNVEVVTFQGLLIDFTKKMHANVIVRGIRAVSDFEYELMMAQTNKQLCPEVETMLFATSAEYSFLSSSTVRELAYFQGDITPFVPDYVKEKIYSKMKEKRK
ncbi:MAG: pantetheine-phosphate adenylyltransferase [Clostridiales bacterium]|nr:pantetheine-phosphate adenylyltransferase [Clostridiales bacterium]